MPVTQIFRLFIAYLKPPVAFHFTFQNFMKAVALVQEKTLHHLTSLSVDFIPFSEQK